MTSSGPSSVFGILSKFGHQKDKEREATAASAATNQTNPSSSSSSSSPAGPSATSSTRPIPTLSSSLDGPKSFEGYLTKIGGSHQSWRRRYFKLQGTSLSYYKTPTTSKPIDSLEVKGAAITSFNNNNTYGRKFLFGLTPNTAISNGRMYLLQGETETDRSQWIQSLVLSGAHDLGMSGYIQTHQSSRLEGYLDRIRGGFQSSLRCYFVLLNDRMCYWRTNVIGNTPPEKTIPLTKDARIEVGSNTPTNFSLTPALKEARIVLAAIDKDERTTWINAINGVIAGLGTVNTSTTSTSSGTSGTSTAGNTHDAPHTTRRLSTSGSSNSLLGNKHLQYQPPPPSTSTTGNLTSPPLNGNGQPVTPINAKNFVENPMRKQSNIHDDPDSGDEDEDFGENHKTFGPLATFQENRKSAMQPRPVENGSKDDASHRGKQSISISTSQINAHNSKTTPTSASSAGTVPGGAHRKIPLATKDSDEESDNDMPPPKQAGQQTGKSGGGGGKPPKRRGGDSEDEDDSDNDARFNGGGGGGGFTHVSDDDEDEDDIVSSHNATALINLKKGISLSPNPIFGLKITAPPPARPPPSRPGMNNLQFTKEAVKSSIDERKVPSIQIDSADSSPNHSPRNRNSQIFSAPSTSRRLDGNKDVPPSVTPPVGVGTLVSYSSAPNGSSSPSTPHGSSIPLSLTATTIDELFHRYQYDWSSIRTALSSLVDDAERDRLRKGEKSQEKLKEDNAKKAADEMKSILEAKYSQMMDTTGSHRPVKMDEIDGVEGADGPGGVHGANGDRSSRKSSLIIPPKHFLRAKTMMGLINSGGKERERDKDMVSLSAMLNEEEFDDKLIHIHLVEGVDFPAMDANGFSDPYTESYLNSKAIKKKTSKHKSKTCYETLDPLWDEQFTLDFPVWGEELVIDAFDYDKFSVDDFCGRVVIHMGEVIQQIHMIQMASKVSNHGDHISGVRISGWYPLVDKETRINGQGYIFLHLVIDDRWVAANKRDSDAFIHARQVMLGDDHAMKWNYSSIHTSITNIVMPYSSPSPLYNPLYESASGVRLFLGSWNVGNAPPPMDLTPWVPLGHADVYVIGTQECNYTPRMDIKSCKVDWMMVLVRHFGRDYTLLKYNNLWEMRVAVFVVNRLAKYVTHLATHTEATGVGNVLGNKGGVIISFNVYHTSFCFVNSHLAAHQEHILARNANVKSIIKNIKIGPTHSDIINSFHHVFWMGDLNYRLDFGGQGAEKSPSREQFQEMSSIIFSNDLDRLSDLYVHDQLLKEMTAKRVFVGFKEGRYGFPPTFKVKRRVKLEYNAERSPAWCDRILWRSVPGFLVDQVQFNAATRIPTSDHKPVSAIFNVNSFWLPPPVDPARGECTLRIFFLNTNNLKIPKNSIGKTVDPYLIINSASLYKPIQTSVQKKVQNARWTELPVVKIQYNSIRRLERTLFFVRVLNHASNDVVIGRGIIELTGLQEGSNKRNSDKELGIISDNSISDPNGNNNALSVDHISSTASASSSYSSVPSSPLNTSPRPSYTPSVLSIDTASPSVDVPPPPPETETMLQAVQNTVNLLTPMRSPIASLALAASKERPSLHQSMSVAQPSQTRRPSAASNPYNTTSSSAGSANNSVPASPSSAGNSSPSPLGQSLATRGGNPHVGSPGHLEHSSTTINLSLHPKITNHNAAITKSSSSLAGSGGSRGAGGEGDNCCDYEFTISLTSNGLPAGTLQGFFRFLFDTPKQNKKH